jgi:hypothetical protein
MSFMSLVKILSECLPYFLWIEFKKNRDNKRKDTEIQNLKNTKVENFGIFKMHNKECVILGNGPSLKESLSGNSLDFIKDRIVFCVNNAVVSDEFLLLKPSFVVFMDPFYWSKNTVEPYFSIYTQIAGILSNVDWKTTIFMPKAASEWNFFIDVPIKNNNVEIKYINTNGPKYDNDLRFTEFKTNHAMPTVQNVLVACIYIALNIGFKTIYIFGADHSWHESFKVMDDNILYYKNQHYYDKENQQKKYTPMYKNPEQTQIWTCSEIFLAFSNKFKSYEELEKYSRYMGAKIYNASKISYIDAFERIKFE